MTREAFRAFNSPSALFEALANAIAQNLSAAIASRGHASFVSCGGTTPGDFYDVLSQRVLAWERVTITLSDERWVEPSSDRSNEHLVRARLLTRRAGVASFVALKTGQARAVEAEPEIHERIAAIARPFDAVLLGMGSDGHTASLIPGAAGLARALDASDPALARAIVPLPETGMGERVSLTLRALLGSKVIFLLIRGDDKRAAYDRAVSGSDVREAPVRGVLLQNAVPVETFWAE
jgi:6-phosphogluconolactonase